MNQVTEKPILFSGEMVRAILAGRKTQTRRVIKPQPESVSLPAIYCPRKGQYGVSENPYGNAGDRLWVRETWAVNDDKYHRVIFKADEGTAKIGRPEFGRWKPSIHMPRCVSRINIGITDVRVEKLQEITEEGAKAEGLSCVTKDGNLYKYGIPDRDGLPGADDTGWPWQEWKVDPRQAYKKLWDAINEKRGYGWDANPWVWVVEFDLLEVKR